MAFGYDAEAQARRVAASRQRLQQSQQQQAAGAARGKGIGQAVGTGAGIALNLIPGVGPAAAAVGTPLLAGVGGALGEFAAGGKPQGGDLAMSAADTALQTGAAAVRKGEGGKKTNLALLAEALKD
jgi:hypothetical protein